MSGESLPSGVLKVAEPSEEASSLPVVAWLHKVVYTNGHRGTYLDSEEHAPHIDRESQRSVEDVALTPLADAQSQLNAMRVERDKWYQEAAAQAASAIAAHDELAATVEQHKRDMEAVEWCTAGAQKIIAERDEARAAITALKAVQIAPAAGGVVEDTERLDWLDSTPAVNVDDMSMREWLWKRPASVGNIRDAIDAAREALRAALASPEGSPR